jgi:hypothetical protein
MQKLSNFNHTTPNKFRNSNLNRKSEHHKKVLSEIMIGQFYGRKFAGQGMERIDSKVDMVQSRVFDNNTNAKPSKGPVVR